MGALEDWSLFDRLLRATLKDPQRVITELQSAGVVPAQWEASVRCDREGHVSGQRIMFESSAFSLVSLIASFWGYELPEEVSVYERICKTESIAVITGWDASCDPPVVKLYINASDLSLTVRQKLWGQTLWSKVVEFQYVPHILALNFSRLGCERKAYVQFAKSVSDLPGYLVNHDLLEKTFNSNIYAGSVVCWDWFENGRFDPRAFFVALNAEKKEHYEPLLTSLRLNNFDQIDRVLPFVRGQCRSVGVSLLDPDRWTLYFKPSGLSVPLWDLEPVARFAFGPDGTFQVSIFVEPVASSKKSYARTEKWAVSFRTHGSNEPSRDVVRAFMDWTVSLVRYAEKKQLPLEDCFRRVRPPSVWRFSVNPVSD